jgi:transcriptional regulator with XRE-family HTH domain
MTQPDDVEGLPSPSSALLQLARLKAGMSQRELAERAGVPVTMISAYERDQRQPTLLRLLRAAGFDLWTAPMILEALIPGRMQSHASTAEEPRRAA